MISRLLITLILTSSLCITAAPEIQPAYNAESNAHAFTGLTLTASLIAIGIGAQYNNPGITGCGFGLLTGLGCALFERQCRQDGIVILSWAGEGIIREETIEHILELDKRANGAARVGSWLAYLGYYAAAIADKE